VTYCPNGGVGNNIVVPVNANTYYTIRDQGYSRNGYIQDGWTTRTDGLGVNYANNQVVYLTTSITLYAKWKLNPSISVTYHPNGGVGNINVVPVNANTYYTIQAQSYTRNGYTQDGWNTRADGLGVNYSNNQVIYLTTSITLYAKWKQSTQQLKVTYDPNCGIGSIRTIYVNPNSNYTIETAANLGFSLPNYELYNWNTQPNATGTNYNERQIIYLTTDITLYAQWIYKH
jgi:uncharacterized repeat protein (TIGR02543 family)